MSNQPTRTMHRTQVGQAYRAVKIISIGLIGVAITLCALAVFVIGYVSLHNEVDEKARDSLCAIRHDYKRMIHNGRRVLAVHPENVTVRLNVRGWRITYGKLNKLKCKS